MEHYDLSPFSASENLHVVTALTEAGFPLAWLGDATLVWEEEAEGGPNGYYNVFLPDYVFINSLWRSTLKSPGCEMMIMGTVAHELTHRRQHHWFKWSYHLLAIPFLRRWTIEPPAERWEKRVNDALGVDEGLRL